MKKLSLLLFAVLLFTSINAQTDKSALVPKPKDTTPDEAGKVGKAGKDTLFIEKNAIDFQLLGNSLLFSVNYENSIYKSFLGSDKICLRVGGLYSGGNFIIPLSIANIYGAKHNAFEAGLGLTIDIDDVSRISPTINTYYRYQARNKFLFRVGISLIYNSFYSDTFFPVPGMSFGWSF